MDDDCFFTGAEARRVKPRPLPTLQPRCGECGFKPKCVSPVMPPVGRGVRRILVIGEAPGREEDERGEPFVGPSGEVLGRGASRAGIVLRRDCVVHNAVCCRPPGNDLSKTVSGNAVDHCRPNVLRVIDRVDPVVIVLVGGAAVRSVVARAWGVSDPGGISRWAGMPVPCRSPNAWLVPTYHPAFLLRAEDSAADRDFESHWRTVAELADRGTRPWPDGPPDHSVGVVADPDDAVAWLRTVTGGEIAFDFETDRLKPDHADARVVCCSVSTGDATIGFPWTRATAAEMKRILERPDIGKIGWNVKFEERWCRRMGISVRGWAWDGMLAAHCLDPRGGVTGLKFQAFARLGEPDFNSHVEPYLESPDGSSNTANRITQISFPLLLKYCATDSLLEYKVSRIQRWEMGVGPEPTGPGYPAT